MLKTRNCGELRKSDVGQSVTLAGWVHRRRDHGGLIFLDVRDRSGIVQVVCDAEVSETVHQLASTLRSEFVVQIKGDVRARPPALINPNLSTGEIEVATSDLHILNPAQTTPFAINDESEVSDTVRLKYRYLDLRRQRMQRNLMLRHRVISFIRRFLDQRDFIDIETPILLKSTPEGARDFVVPSRVHPGKFYALPQSPQQMKQLLMVAGFERYFQIARCFRDEDLRADRQLEFTQLDLEMSFVDSEDVQVLMEGMMLALFAQLSDKKVQLQPFPIFTYAEAMERYGSDKPDLRFGMELLDLSDLLADSGFGVFASTVQAGGQIKALCAPGCATYSRRQLDELTAEAKQKGAKGLVWMKVVAEGLRSPVTKYLSAAEQEGILRRTQAQQGDLILIVADQPAVVAEALGHLRLLMAKQLGLMDANVLACAWVVDFPLLEWSEEENRWQAMHHPFTSARDQDWPLLATDPGAVLAKAYDLVCNGMEIGGGSIRIHQQDHQNQMFAALGISPETAQAQFGHLLEAFQYGAPPHGGIALGLDRIVAILADEASIRDVIAFPKTASATDLMLNSPSPLDATQLTELRLAVTTADDA
ncbi:MAG: aspartate--tRNA ligase [Chloroflexi bacterium]|nr:aspartate--tRNA ligase [Chloroflexota bacterium]